MGRIGGDEFVIILQGLNEDSEAGITAQRIIDSFSENIEVDSQVCTVGASIGISVFPSDSDNAEELIRLADTAMYQSKKDGGSRFSFYSPNSQS